MISHLESLRGHSTQSAMNTHTRIVGLSADSGTKLGQLWPTREPNSIYFASNQLLGFRLFPSEPALINLAEQVSVGLYLNVEWKE